MKKLLSSIFLILIFLTGCGSSEDEAVAVQSTNNEVKQNVETPKYKFITTKGEKLEIELVNDLLISDELNGKIVLLNFWATWCPPCKKEMPEFVKLQEKYKDKLIIVGILMEKEKDKKELQSFLDELKINFPITVDADNFKFAKDFGDVKMYPESYLFSKNGLLLKKFIGEVDLRTLESYIIDNI